MTESSPEPVQPRMFVAECIRFDNPPRGESDDDPQCVPVDADGYFDASGGTENEQITAFLSVEGQVGSGPTIPGTPTAGASWSLPGVGPAVLGQINSLTVNARVRFQDGTETSCSASVPFIAYNDDLYYPCPDEQEVSAEIYTSEAIASIIPRHYKLTMHLPTLDRQEEGSLLFGGLLQRSHVYLAYDPAVSTPMYPMWRDINMPSFVGHWSLRVRRVRRILRAELVLQPMSATEVLPPTILQCDSWDFRGRNVFTVSQRPQGASEFGFTVLVEPA